MTKEEAAAPVTTEIATAVQSKSYVPRGMPKRMTVKCKYFEQISLDPVAGGAAVGVFRANSGYDPYQSGAGHQPKYQDQYFALYDKAVVLASRIIVKAANPTAGNNHLIGVCLRNDATVEVAPQSYVEDANNVFAICNPSVPNAEVSLGYVPTFFGDTYKNPQADDELHYTAGADAGKQAYYHVYIGACLAAENPAAASFQVLIEYTIQFFEPNSVGSS